MSPAARALVLLVLCAVAVLAADSRAAREKAAGAGLVTRDGDTVEISESDREAGLRFGPAVAPGDRAWVVAAVERARPEAQRLIGEVDGLIEVRTGLAVEGAIGLTEAGPDGIVVTLDVAALNGAAALQRDTVVLHELGHVIDFALIPRALGERLDAEIPRGGTCSSPADSFGACAQPEERFADTFAKWALRGAVSAAGAGYGIPTPASLEDWGAPLGGFAAGLERG